MSKLQEATLLAFEDELSKVALQVPWQLSPGSTKLRALGGGVGTGAGLGAGAGLALGGALGAKRGYEASREQGGSRLSAVVHGLLGGVGGAASGAAKGLVAGAAAGGAAGALRPLETTNAARRIGAMGGPTGSFARFGQRQVHGLTGWTPSYGRKGLDALRLDASEGAKQMGLTSVPGTIKAVQREGLGKILKQTAKDQLGSSSLPMKVLNIGVPAATIGANLMHKETDEGPGKGEMAGKALGMASGLLLPTGLPVGANILSGMALDKGFGAVGKGIDRLRGRKDKPLAPIASEPGDTGMTAVEHVHGTGLTGDLQ